MATNIIEGSMTTASLWLNITYERYICPDKTMKMSPQRVSRPKLDDSR